MRRQSLLALTWQEKMHVWMRCEMSVLWSKSMSPGQCAVVSSPSLTPFSVFLSPSNNCTAAPTAVRRSAADLALYQLDWSHLASLLLPWSCPARRSKMEEEGAGLGSWGPNAGCKALAKSNMALFVFAGRSPSVCFRPGCPPGLAVHWAWK